MTATVSRPVHLYARLPQARLPLDLGRFGPAAGLIDRSRTALADAAALLGVVFAIPFVILIVGTPIALAIVALLSVARWASNTF